MIEYWKDVVISKIAIAIYVQPNTGRHEHVNRSFHGFVLNDEDSVKD